MMRDLDQLIDATLAVAVAAFAMTGLVGAISVLILAFGWLT